MVSDLILLDLLCCGSTLCFLFVSRVNCYDVVKPQTPFGGFKMSGIGREMYVSSIL